MLGHHGVYPLWEGVAMLDHGPQGHQAAAAVVTVGGGVDVQHHGHQGCTKLFPDSDPYS